MNSFATRSRKVLAVLVTATVLAGSLTVSSGASAKPIWFPKPFPIYHGPHFGGLGLGAAIVGGLAIGALAAGAAESEGECYITHRHVFDAYGNEYIRRVRVCE